jgi:CHAT domain
MTYDLTVEVSNGNAKATLDKEGERGAVLGEATIDNDSLRLETVGLLQQWLGRWQLISEIGLKNEDFPVLETFRVLGEHLFEMVFRDDVRTAFTTSYNDAEKDRQPLRVMLSFAEDSAELAALPWEFLYRREESGSSFYLATATQLVLNRFLPARRPQMPLADLPLRVLVVMCIPPSDDPDQEEQMEEREEILASIRKLQERPEQLDVSIVERWDIDSVQAALKNDPHVVHIVGHAQHVRDSMGRVGGQIQLPDNQGRLQWIAPQTVIDLLTRGKSPEHLPRLVLLHLCEMKPVNFTASFERLAPEFIKAGILAVLAMQYPMSADASRKFTDKFYTRLAEGDEIDQIVQDARFDMASRLQDNRLIGTPVLYMQSIGGQLVAVQADVPSKGKIDPHQLSTRLPTDGSSGIRQRLKATAWSEAAEAGTDQALVRELDEWIDSTEWSNDPAEGRRQIVDHMSLDPNISERGPIYTAMLRTLSGRQT